jgi:hypothetical protein
MTATSNIPAITFLACALSTSLAYAATTTTVAVPEAVVRSAPADVAPEVVRVHAGDVLTADDHAHSGWRRVQVADGRYGFMREETPSTRPASVVAHQAGPEGGNEKTIGRLGVMFSLMPAGTISGSNTSTDANFALAVAPFFDMVVSPYFSVGVSPQAILRVKGDGDAGESAKQFDLRARLTGGAPLSPRVGVFARVSPGYSIVSLPSPPPSIAAATNPKGLVVDAAVGTEVALLPNLFLTVDLGYQAGFQSSSDGDLHTSYLHLGAGLAVGL